MILHIFEDEKFVDLAIAQFEKVSGGQNEYIVALKENETQTKYVKNLSKAILLKYNSKEIENYIQNFSNYETVIFHFLSDEKIEILKNIPEGLNICWICWGMDFYYKLPLSKFKLYDGGTYKVLLKSSSASSLLHLIKKTKIYSRYLDKKKQEKLEALKQISGKIKFYSTIIPNEKEIVEGFLGLKATYVRFNYGGILKPINQTPTKTNELNCLVGNSGTPENNHFEIFALLDKLNLKDLNVITPLSYGQTNYINEINHIGLKTFGGRFKALLTFLDIDDYNKIINSCSVCIMNHYRQQAIGNIIYMIWIGAKVFLNKNNPTYDFLNKLGVKVYNIGSINKQNIRNRLGTAEIEKNKKVIEQEFGDGAINVRTLQFIKLITG